MKHLKSWRKDLYGTKKKSSSRPWCEKGITAFHHRGSSCEKRLWSCPFGFLLVLLSRYKTPSLLDFKAGWKLGMKFAKADICTDLKPMEWDFLFFVAKQQLVSNKQGHSRLSLPKWHSCCTFTILGVLPLNTESQILALHVLSSEREITEWERGLILGLELLYTNLQSFFPSTFSISRPLCVFPKWKAPCSTVLTPRLRSCGSSKDVNREFLLLWPHPSREGE